MNAKQLLDCGCALLLIRRAIEVSEPGADLHAQIHGRSQASAVGLIQTMASVADRDMTIREFSNILYELEDKMNKIIYR